MAIAPKSLSKTIEFEGKTPAGHGQRLIRIPIDKLLAHFARTHNLSKLKEAYLVPDVCQQPAGIWRGLDRSNQEESFCYAGHPTCAFATECSVAVDVPLDRVLCVYLTPDLEVTKWRFCESDKDNHGFPVDHATRFGERLWPQQV